MDSIEKLDLAVDKVMSYKDLISPIDAWLAFFDTYNIGYQTIDNTAHSPMFAQEEAFAKSLIVFKKELMRC